MKISINLEKSMMLLLVIGAFLMMHVQSASLNDTSTEDRSFKTDEVETGRTFGQIKKFQAALLPIMYKLGVMSAVIFMTLFLAFKSVFIGTLILILNVVFFAVKFGAFLKQDNHYISHQPMHGHGWAPHKDVHLHIHNAHGKPDFSIPYSTLSGNGGWDSQGHSSAVEATWTAPNYVHAGRSLPSGSGRSLAIADDLAAYASTPHVSTQHPSIDQDKLYKTKTVQQRIDREPTIVMAQTKNTISPYNYLNKQNRK